MVKTLFSSPDVELRHGQHGGDICFVTFTSLGRDHVEGFGQRLFEGRKMSGLYLISRWDHWYQPESVQEALAIVQDVVKAQGYRRVITYGASMGGFGAAAYSKLLGADASILIAPQYSIDPFKPPFERRWTKEAKAIPFAHRDLTAAINPNSAVSVIFDPYSDDRHQAEQFLQTPNCHPIHVPFGGHTASRVLKRAGLIKALVLGLAAGTFDEAAFFRVLHRRRRWAPEWWMQLSEHARMARGSAPSETRLLFSLYALDQVLRRQPDQVTALLDKTYLLLRLNRVEESLAAAEQATSLAPAHPAPWRALSVATSRAGNSDQALSAARKAEILRPHDPDLQRVLLDRLIEADALEEAIHVGRRAIVLDGNDARTYAQTGHAMKRVGKLEQASRMYMHALLLRPDAPHWQAELRTIRDDIARSAGPPSRYDSDKPRFASRSSFSPGSGAWRTRG